MRFLQIQVGTARPLAQTFDVKKRVYYGNTSMEAEVSLLMANQTKVCHPLYSTSKMGRLSDKHIMEGFT